MYYDPTGHSEVPISGGYSAIHNEISRKMMQTVATSSASNPVPPPIPYVPSILSLFLFTSTPLHCPGADEGFKEMPGANSSKFIELPKDRNGKVMFPGNSNTKISLPGDKDFFIQMSRWIQEHHVMTNKNNKRVKAYTPYFDFFAYKYGLDLDDDWNKITMYHKGSHPNEYHDFVIEQVMMFDDIAQGSVNKFMNLYDGLKEYNFDNPDLLNTSGYE